MNITNLYCDIMRSIADAIGDVLGIETECHNWIELDEVSLEDDLE